MTLKPLTLALAFGLLGTTAIASAQAEIDEARAEQIALEQVPNATVESVERDDEDGQTVYEVELLTSDGVEHEVVIDARDGRVLSVEEDD